MHPHTRNKLKNKNHHLFIDTPSKLPHLLQIREILIQKIRLIQAIAILAKLDNLPRILHQIPDMNILRNDIHLKLERNKLILEVLLPPHDQAAIR